MVFFVCLFLTTGCLTSKHVNSGAEHFLADRGVAPLPARHRDPFAVDGHLCAVVHQRHLQPEDDKISENKTILAISPTHPV